ncbi:MAG: rod shape-determining protein RodA [Saprospiraceae bacterium]|nr:rod shape-determining protein RodA [Saprospiraceae bacterium]MBK8670960.1 rod shape-determining protein RodA [Saprospiraceae bacterium]
MAVKALSKDKTVDWVTLAVYISLLVIGWFMVFSTLYDPKVPYAFMDFTSPLGAQTLWVVLSVFVLIIALTLDWKFWNTLAFPIYGATILLLILVLFLGKEINGAKAWFSFGFFSIQPSEWAKFGTALAVASYLSFFKTSITTTNVIIISIAIFLGPALLILLQPDFGSSIVFFSFFILLYRRGMSPWIIIVGLSVAAIFILSLLFSPFIVSVLLVFLAALIFIFDIEKSQRALLISGGLTLSIIFLLYQMEKQLVIIPALLGFLVYVFLEFRKRNFKILSFVLPVLTVAILFSFTSSYVFDNFLKPHQQDRINVWLRPEKCDPRGSLYNIIQSKLAIGSGGLQGKGFLQGEMTKLDYVPEQSTDFIFTSIGEEQGFIGSLGVIILYTILLLRCIIIAERANLEFIRNYAYGVFGILLVHFTFNIGMTMGLLPVIGIPLPFLSKGGSSLLAFSLMIAVLIKMDLARFRSN